MSACSCCCAMNPSRGNKLHQYMQILVCLLDAIMGAKLVNVELHL